MIIQHGDSKTLYFLVYSLLCSLVEPLVGRRPHHFLWRQMRNSIESGCKKIHFVKVTELSFYNSEQQQLLEFLR